MHLGRNRLHENGRSVQRIKLFQKKKEIRAVAYCSPGLSSLAMAYTQVAPTHFCINSIKNKHKQMLEIEIIVKHE